MTIKWAIIGKDGQFEELFDSEKKAKKDRYRFKRSKGYPFHIGRVSIKELYKIKNR